MDLNISSQPRLRNDRRRLLLKRLLLTCVCLVGFVGHAAAQSVVVRPDQLREGDGQTRSIVLTVKVDAGAQVSVAVNYTSDPNNGSSTFIPRFTVQDNANNDRSPQAGIIELLLPKSFERTGVYIIEVDKPDARLSLKLVHEPDNSWSVRRFFERLIAAAGGGDRHPNPESVLERIEEVTKNNEQEQVAVWIAPVPVAGQELKRASLKPIVKSALTPSWSKTGNYLVCSAWRNGKWTLAAFTVNRVGRATPLWQWSTNVTGVTDFSPVWSPNGDAIAFVRVDSDHKSDIWLLELDRNRRPKREKKVTNFGNVQAISVWHAELGILFEAKTELENRPDIQHLWAIKTPVANAQPILLADEFELMRGEAPRRQSVFYLEDRKGPPWSVLYEANANGKFRVLLDESCAHRGLVVSSDERWIAFDSNCSQ